MTNPSRPGAIAATAVAVRKKPSNYPPPFAARMAGRSKRQLGDFFGLDGFGLNLTELAPGAVSALRHAHEVQDEMIYVLKGQPTLIDERGETLLSPGMCAGFKGGDNNAHQLVNNTAETVTYLEIGDRRSGDAASYPDDDICAVQQQDGSWAFQHKDGRPY